MARMYMVATKERLVGLLFGLTQVLRCELDTLAVDQRGTREQGANGISDISSGKNRDWKSLPRSVPLCDELARSLRFNI